MKTKELLEHLKDFNVHAYDEKCPLCKEIYDYLKKRNISKTFIKKWADYHWDADLNQEAFRQNYVKMLHELGHEVGDE